MKKLIAFLALLMLAAFHAPSFADEPVSYSVFFPNKEYPGSPAQYHLPDMKAVTFKTDDGLSLESWFQGPKEKDGPVIVFFHGNGGNRLNMSVVGPYLLPLGYGLMFCEYRGYGGNPGEPSEEGIYKDARACLKWMEGQGYSESQFVLYGESLGSSVALQMAIENETKIVVLESAFSTGIDVWNFLFPGQHFEDHTPDRFDNMSRIGKVHAKLLFMHGDADESVPDNITRKLYDAANPPKEFAVIHGAGHNDLYLHDAGDVLAAWLAKNVGLLKQPAK